MNPSSTPKTRVVIAVGGTGGHLFPAQALARQLPQTVVPLLMGTGLTTTRFLQLRELEVQEVVSATPFRGSIVKNIQALFKIARGSLQALRHLKQCRPKLVIGFGSYHCVPTVLAARLLGIPIVLVEPNILPGRVNRICSYFAHTSCVQFEAAKRHLKGRVVSTRIPSLYAVGGSPSASHERLRLQEEGRAYFGLERTLPTLLIFGGSQGAQPINRCFCGALKQLVADQIPLQILHIVGSPERAACLREWYDHYPVPAVVHAFEQRMDLAWHAASLCIARAGASTLKELIAFTTPAILIPYPHALDQHQRANAAFAQEIGGGMMVAERDLTAACLVELVTKIFDDSGALLTQMEGALRLYREKQPNQELLSEILSHLELEVDRADDL